MALEISNLLKDMIRSGRFELTNMVKALPLEGEYRTLDILSQEEL
jgi:hypothetical protein